LFSQEFGRFGIEVSFVNPLEQRTWKRGLKKNTRAIFVETPTNPLLRVIDLEPVATLCKTEGLALLVDSTFATPLNYRPLEHGADVVIHSATKYLNGHSDVLAGAVAGSESVIEEVRKLLHVWGQALDPMAAWLIDRGMKTLAVRVGRQNQTALAVAEEFDGEPLSIALGDFGFGELLAAEPREAVSSLFDAMGQATFVIGTKPSEANLVKLSGNFLIASMLESLGEAFALVRKSGLDPHRYLNILTSTLFSAPVYRTYGSIIAEDRLPADGFKMSLGLKDMRLALAAADARTVPMPVASLVRDHFIEAVAQGKGDADWSGLAQLAARRAGL